MQRTGECQLDLSPPPDAVGGPLKRRGGRPLERRGRAIAASRDCVRVRVRVRARVRVRVRVRGRVRVSE
jgi:hypothetical protein